MEKAIEKDPKIIYGSDVFERRSALHHAAASPTPAATNVLTWLLEKGIPWNASDINECIPEDLARISKHEESRKILREWAVKTGEGILINIYSIITS